MSVTEIKKRLRTLFAEDKLKQVFAILESTLSPEIDTYLEYMNLRRRFNQLKDLLMSGTLDFTDYLQESNKLSYPLLQLIDNLRTSDLIIKKEEEVNFVDNPILVITDSFNSQTFLDKFFREINFRKVDVILENDPVPTAQYDLLIFDNRKIGFCPDLKTLNAMSLEKKIKIEHRILLMEKFMKQKGGFLIHFGDYFFWVSKNRERVHAANSQFSLFARTREVLDFINTYRL